jgi:dolichol kinase
MTQAVSFGPGSFVRPANVARTFFHVLSGVGTVLLIELVLSELGMLIVALSVATWAWSMEISRRFSVRWNQMLMRFFKAVAHPHESFAVNSSTWYMTALVFLALTHNKIVASLGVIILAIGDPAAGWFGRAFGRTKLVGSRSLEGTLAFILFAAPASFLVLFLFHPEVSLSNAIAIAVVASIAGAMAELFAARWDDNFLVPVAAGTAALALVIPLGLFVH